MKIEVTRKELIIIRAALKNYWEDTDLKIDMEENKGTVYEYQYTIEDVIALDAKFSKEANK